MSAPYIPTKDDALDAWALNFSSLITATPAVYGLVAADAVVIQNAYDLYHAAFLLGGSSGNPPLPNNPSTFTRVTVAAKNAEKIAGTQIWRTYASQIRLNPGVTNADKIALGLNLPNNSPSPIPAPATFPILAVAAQAQLLHVIRFADSATPALRAKPTDVIQLQLYRGVAVAPIVDPALTDLYASVTKQPFQASFSNPADAGKIATYFGRWLTRKGLIGPWSAPISAVVS